MEINFTPDSNIGFNCEPVHKINKDKKHNPQGKNKKVTKLFKKADVDTFEKKDDK